MKYCKKKNKKSGNQVTQKKEPERPFPFALTLGVFFFVVAFRVFSCGFLLEFFILSFFLRSKENDAWYCFDIALICLADDVEEKKRPLIKETIKTVETNTNAFT